MQFFLANELDLLNDMAAQPKEVYMRAFSQGLVPLTSQNNLYHPTTHVFLKLQITCLVNFINEHGFTKNATNILCQLIANEYHADLQEIVSKLNAIKVCRHTSISCLRPTSRQLLSFLATASTELEEKLQNCALEHNYEKMAYIQVCQDNLTKSSGVLKTFLTNFREEYYFNKTNNSHQSKIQP